MRFSTIITYSLFLFASNLLQAEEKYGIGRTYRTFNFPGATTGSKTLLTGIRGSSKNSQKVYICGFYKCPEETCVVPFVYKGYPSGKGTWSVLNYPSGPGRSVLVTNLYGPSNAGNHNIRVVGNYVTEEMGGTTAGCLYEGPLDGTGKWRTIVPDFSEPATNTIVHSTMGDLAVGIYQMQSPEDKAFIYDIKQNKYFNIAKPNAKIITAYGVWHNGDHSYTICGGYSDLDAATGVGSAYLVDWDNKRQKLSNWRTYNFDNNPLTALVTHFDGITSDGYEGYNLTGDWIGVSEGPELGFFCNVNKKGQATWSSLAFPDEEITSGNSVHKSTVVGVYTSSDETVNGYISSP